VSESSPLPVSSILSVPPLETLSADDLDALYTQVARLEADLRARLLTRHPASQPDRVLSLPEAAQRLGMTTAWLSRRGNWQRVGGYKDRDRKIKFPLSALEAYVRARGGA
jgi:hypothetical protein